MTKTGIEDGTHLGLRHAGTTLGQLHEILVVLLDLGIERHATDINLMLQIAIEIGCLLIVDGHLYVGMRASIVKEARPEHLDILMPQGCQQGLLLIERVVAVAVCKPLHDEFLSHHIIIAYDVVAGPVSYTHLTLPTKA